MSSITGFNQTITLTFGEMAENHHGMEKIGHGLAESGFSVDELKELGKKLPTKDGVP